MKIDKRILDVKQKPLELGDIVVDKEGYVFMIVAETNEFGRIQGYRLLRLRDADPDYRLKDAIFENTLSHIMTEIPKDLLDESYTIIPADKVSLVFNIEE